MSTLVTLKASKLKLTSLKRSRMRLKRREKI